MTDLSEQLVAAALAQLDSGAEISLRSVARAAGVSAMAPYRHFADKEALLAAVTQRGFERLTVWLRAADAAGDSRAALRAQGLAYIGFALESPALFRLMFTGVKRGPLPGGDDAFDIMANRAAEIMPAAPDAAALTCWGTVHGLALLALDQRLREPIDARIERALTLLVDSLSAAQATSAA